MNISKFFCISIALLFIVGFAAIGHAEEGIMSKVNDMFTPETAEGEKEVAGAESRDDVTLPQSEQYGEEEEEVVLKVTGMTCAACEHSVKTALMNCENVEGCELNWEEGKATINVAKGSANTAEMINTVKKAGFTASAELEEDIQYGAESEIKGTEKNEATEEESQNQEKE